MAQAREQLDCLFLFFAESAARQLEFEKRRAAARQPHAEVRMPWRNRGTLVATRPDVMERAAFLEFAQNRGEALLLVKFAPGNGSPFAGQHFGLLSRSHARDDIRFAPRDHGNAG